MNIKSIILSSLALVVISAVAMTIDSERKRNSYFDKEMAKESKKESAGVQGSIEFFRDMRANPLTGKIEVDDVEQVMQQVRKQQNDAKKTTALTMMEWEERGPDNIGGRTRGMMVDINDTNKLYMGNVSGGFFTSTDRGNTWVKMAGMDSAARMSVSCMTQTANGDIYYGTGESFAEIGGVRQFNGIPGGGIFKSTDGGISSTVLPQTKPSIFNSDNTTWATINRLEAHPTNPNKVYAAINRGLYVTDNGGTTWTKAVTPTAPVLDLDISSSGNVIIASTINQIYLSTDGGANFTLGLNSTTVGLPGASNINRVEVEIAPSDENVMYAVMSENTANGNETKGIYKSIDKGSSWTAIGVGGSQVFNPLGTQGTYNIALGVHPTNADMVFVGGQLNLYRYTPTNLWEVIAYANNSAQTGRYVHADMHGVMFNHGNPNEMYVVNDGGFFRTSDCTVPNPYFVEKNKNYSTAQCYGVAANNLGHIIFGTQDNSTNLINGTYANSPKTSIPSIGGDGMRGAASDIDTKFLYGEAQYGRLRGSQDGGSSTASFKVAFDANIDVDWNTTTASGHGRPDEGSSWIAPVTLAEKVDTGAYTQSVLFIGLAQNVWFTQQGASTKTKLWFPLVNNGGPSGEGVTSGFSAIAVSEDGTTVFAGTGNGQLYRISNLDIFGTKYEYDNDSTGGVFGMDSTFVIDVLTSPAGGAHITDLEIKGNTLLLTTPSYGVVNHVYRSLNALAPTPVFTSIQNNLPSMPVYSAAFLNNPNSYLVGTDLGVWGTDDAGATWTELNNIAGPESEWHPRCAVLQIAVKPYLSTSTGSYVGDIVYTGTYGRGTFMSKTRSSFFPLSAKDVESKTGNTLKVYPNPVGSTANVQYNVSKGGEAMIKVTNLNGRIIKNTFANLEVGDNTIQVDLSGVSSGVYMVSVTSKNGTATTKIVKR